MEIWKPIKNYEGLYEISNFGNVKSLSRKINDYRGGIVKKEKILTPTDNGHGYQIIGLSKNNHRKNYYVHRLVASYFIDNPDNLEQVNHKDFDKSNNCVENLEWCSRSRNIKHFTNSQFFNEVKEKKGTKLAFRLANKIVKYKKDIIARREKQESIQQIADELNIGRDFVSIVCYIFDI